MYQYLLFYFYTFQKHCVSSTAHTPQYARTKEIQCICSQILVAGFHRSLWNAMAAL